MNLIERNRTFFARHFWFWALVASTFSGCGNQLEVLRTASEARAPSDELMEFDSQYHGSSVEAFPLVVVVTNEAARTRGIQHSFVGRMAGSGWNPGETRSHFFQMEGMGKGEFVSFSSDELVSITGEGFQIKLGDEGENVSGKAPG